MHKYCFFVFLFVGPALSAQSTLIMQEASDIASVDIVQLPKQNNALLKVNAAHKAFGHLIFAKEIKKRINALERGTWESISNGNELWRLRLKSEGATSLNLTFDKYFLPKGSSLIIYSADQSYVVGPFTDYDNRNDRILWTPIIPYDEVILELQISQGQATNLQLEIGQINHGFEDFTAKALTQACHLDVACGIEDGYPQVEKFRDAIRSVGVYTIEGTRLCSGALINNVRQDCRPLFLTANHCGVTTSNASSVVVHWNYENQTCRMHGSAESGAAGDGMLNQFSSGTNLLARYRPSDFALLELEEDVPSESNLYFAGWNINVENYDSTACVHHPNVEEKRISLDDNEIQIYRDDEFFWQVENWEVGSTERGSSGAPLFNKESEIIGQVFGGQAECGNDLWDIFGRLDRSWIGNNTSDSRLMDWLDPQRTGVTKLSGRGCAVILSSNFSHLNLCNRDDILQSLILFVNDGFPGEAQLSTVNSIEGINISYNTRSISPSVNGIANVEISDALAPGAYEIEINANDGTNSASTFLQIQVSNDIPGEITAINPSGTNTVGTNISFEWVAIADFYDIQIAVDENFANLIGSSTSLETSTYNITNLEQQTTYFWRVRGTNACGLGPWTEFIFETGEIKCTTYTADDLPLEIDEEDQSTVISSIDIPLNEIITDVNILNVKGLHTWINDLEFRIISPSDTEVTLLSRECEDERNFDLGFDDESTLQEFPCPYNDRNVYKPANPLSVFKDESTLGAWRLQILDLSDFDGGSFTDWTLEICTNVSKTISTSEEVADNVFATYPNPAGDILFVELKENVKNPSYIFRTLTGSTVISDLLGQSIDLSQLSTGLYLLEVREESKMLGIKKVVIAR